LEPKVKFFGAKFLIVMLEHAIRISRGFDEPDIQSRLIGQILAIGLGFSHTMNMPSMQKKWTKYVSEPPPPGAVWMHFQQYVDLINGIQFWLKVVKPSRINPYHELLYIMLRDPILYPAFAELEDNVKGSVYDAFNRSKNLKEWWLAMQERIKSEVPEILG